MQRDLCCRFGGGWARQTSYGSVIMRPADSWNSGVRPFKTHDGRRGIEMGTIYLTSSPAPQCRLVCLSRRGKCRARFASLGSDRRCFREPSLHGTLVTAPGQRGFARIMHSLRSASCRLMRSECRLAVPGVPCNTSCPSPVSLILRPRFARLYVQ